MHIIIMYLQHIDLKGGGRFPPWSYVEKPWQVSINCELRIQFVFPAFAINRFANINVCVYHNMVRGQSSQLLDL